MFRRALRVETARKEAESAAAKRVEKARKDMERAERKKAREEKIDTIPESPMGTGSVRQTDTFLVGYRPAWGVGLLGPEGISPARPFQPNGGGRAVFSCQ